QVRGEGVEVHVVEGQADSVVAELGEQTEGVVETEDGEAVGAVAETQGDGLPRGRLCALAAAPVPVARRVVAHVMLTFLIAARRANHRPAGARAATRREVTGAPARAARAAWSGIVARMPPPTARWVSGGDGLSAAWKYGRAAVAARAGPGGVARRPAAGAAGTAGPEPGRPGAAAARRPAGSRVRRWVTSRVSTPVVASAARGARTAPPVVSRRDTAVTARV